MRQNVFVSSFTGKAPHKGRIEIVERKGLGNRDIA
jgi:S-adenosylmethionine synthetase